MNCAIHPDKEATGACAYCGRLFCHDCLVDVNGRNFCREHVSKALPTQSQQQQYQQPPYQQPPYQQSPYQQPLYEQPNIYINNANNNQNFNGGYSPMISYKSRLVALLLCIFLGALGFHRFYAGKVGTGLLYLFTFGIFGIGVLIDFILILVGSFRDSYGLMISQW